MNKDAWRSHIKKGQQLAKKMSVRELISQLRNASRGIKRLSIFPYNWWNECLHGVARAGTATVFPQAICMASTFCDELLYKTAKIISAEARAKYNDCQKKGDCGIYKGLTMWSPNVNIFRDPRWGRGQETYGEDPYLTSILGVAFIKGLQGEDPNYIQTAACAKHFAVHSGPEADRHSFNAKVTKKDLFETYLPAFKKAVTDGKVSGIMGAYNRVNGEGCCTSERLIKKLLRSAWGFEGYFVSDCGALCDIVRHHRLAANPIKGAALALNAGCELECGKMFKFLPLSYAFNLVNRETLQSSAARLLAVRSSLGMFANDCPYDAVSPEDNATPEHEAFAVTMAEKGIVLLENNGILPIRNGRQKFLIIGYNAENELAYLGNYFGSPTSFVKLKQAMLDLHADAEYAQGYSYNTDENMRLQAQALEKARHADILLVCTGFDCSLEGEEAGELLQGGGGMLGKQGDRRTLELPQVQRDLLDKLMSVNKKIILLNFSGGATDLRPYKNHADAILQCWYPGAKAGKAIVNLLFGAVSPSGKLPVTFYNSTDDLPSFGDYAMKGRTYRYFDGKVQYPFGYGLTYTTFCLTACSMEDLTIRCMIKNTGEYLCDEVLQVYVRQPETAYPNPIRSLIAVRRFTLRPGEEKEIAFLLSDEDLYSVNEQGDTVYLNGLYTLTVSDGQSIISEPIYFENRNETVIVEKCPL